jgi:flagellar basal-body rod modification protein FlgD
MAVTPVGTPAQPTQSTGAAAKLADTYDSFLQLLTTQLKFQDPLSPMDSNQFIEQLVQFSSVEQQIAINKNLEQLLSLESNNVASTAINMIGKFAMAEGDTIGLTDGEAKYAYDLPENAESVSIAILNSSGQIVYSTPGQGAQGNHEFIWNGESSSGETMPEGEYTIRVSAMDADGNPITAATYIIGRVTRVDSGADGISIVIGGIKVPVGSVRSVRGA